MHATEVRFRALQNTSEPTLPAVVAGLSCALDLAEGQSPGHTLRATAIGLRLATELDWSAESRTTLFYALLLKDAGGSGNAARTADVTGADDRAIKRALRLGDAGSRQARVAGSGAGEAPAWIERMRGGGSRLPRGRRIARELSSLRARSADAVLSPLGLEPAVIEAIGAADERWDGHGHAQGRAGETIPPAARIIAIAQTLDVFLSAYGSDVALDLLRARSGTWFDPALVAHSLRWRHDQEWWYELQRDALAMCASLEPETDATLDDDGLDRVAETYAMIIDAKSPYTVTHSTRVAEIATGIANVLGYDATHLRGLRRAALLHDIGKLGVSNRILDKAAPLTEDERRAVEQHPRLSWSILRDVPGFHDHAWSASLHHERLDGSGYPWALSGDDLDMDARIIAVADAYEAITAARAYRTGLSTEQALRIIGKDSPHRYDGAAFTALEAWVER